jgi:hypothetical protein
MRLHRTWRMARGSNDNTGGESHLSSLTRSSPHWRILTRLLYSVCLQTSTLVMSVLLSTPGTQSAFAGSSVTSDIATSLVMNCESPRPLSPTSHCSRMYEDISGTTFRCLQEAILTAQGYDIPIRNQSPCLFVAHLRSWWLMRSREPASESPNRDRRQEWRRCMLTWYERVIRLATRRFCSAMIGIPSGSFGSLILYTCSIYISLPL